ncbi:MAG: peptidase M15 [Prevotella sp.]|nr:peptidase M15 [Prevotella sp.]
MRKNFQITPHFSYEEMTRSAWAERHHVSNEPDCLQLAAMENLARELLEPLRSQFGPIRINSGFRSQRVNEGVHGVGNSKHLTGEAVDIYLPSEEVGRAYFRFIKEHINFDQLLFEYHHSGAMWIHCSVCLDKRENRHQCFPNYRATYA